MEEYLVEEEVVLEDDEYYYEEEDDDNDDNLFASIQESLLEEHRRRKAADSLEQKEVVVPATTPFISGDTKDEKVEDEYEEQVIERWFGRDGNLPPEDLEAACRQLIPIVYKDQEGLNPETMLRRTPLPELYKYLKQHYDYQTTVRDEPPAISTAPSSQTQNRDQLSLRSFLSNRVGKYVVWDDSDKGSTTMGQVARQGDSKFGELLECTVPDAATGAWFEHTESFDTLEEIIEEEEDEPEEETIREDDEADVLVEEEEIIEESFSHHEGNGVAHDGSCGQIREVMVTTPGDLRGKPNIESNLAFFEEIVVEEEVVSSGVRMYDDDNLDSLRKSFMDMHRSRRAHAAEL